MSGIYGNNSVPAAQAEQFPMNLRRDSGCGGLGIDFIGFVFVFVPGYL